MICNSCGNKEAYHVRTIYDDGEMIDCCNDCARLSSISAGVPDVYLGHVGQKFANLTDKLGNPIEIRSKRHKKEVMDSIGVSEAGDRVNGAPYGSKDWISGSRDVRRKQFENERPRIREALKRWKETGYAREKR